MFSKYVISGTSNPVVVAEPKKKSKDANNWRTRLVKDNLGKLTTSPKILTPIRHALWNVSDGALDRMADPGAAAMWC